jgi:cobalt-zinc-cadmium efflux system outer membrane protein
LTLSVFFQRDGFGENVYGGGISLPLYLPHPLGPTRSGEIAEAESLSQRANAEAERVRAVRRMQLLDALARYSTAKAAAQLYPAQRIESARQTLEQIAQQIQLGKLSPREASTAQNSLLELLHGAIEAERDHAVTSVELAQASGFALEGAHQ